jgi:hypothetical protein
MPLLIPPTFLPRNYEEFVDTFPLFNCGTKVSKHIKKIADSLCYGLALPVLKDNRKLIWGYKDHPKAYMPIETDLKFLFKAKVLFDSKDYLFSDILAWLNSCPLESKKINKESLFKVLKTRPFYKESALPFEERIALIHDFFRFAPTVAIEEERKNAQISNAWETLEEIKKIDKRSRKHR